VDPTGTDVDQGISGCKFSHRRLQDTLGDIDDETVRGPSRLPGWTVGHVLTHLARNADSHARIIRGARAGDHLEQYAGGRDERAEAIEAGAGRHASALVDDVVTSFLTLEDEWDRAAPEVWQDGYGLSSGVVWPCRDLPFFRWREVEVHHADLGLNYDVTDWPEAYVGAELAVALDTLPARLVDQGSRARLLAWLLGRSPQPGSIELQPWQSRPENYLRPGS
jgi:maleylpyruvate isomerase